MNFFLKMSVSLIDYKESIDISLGCRYLLYTYMKLNGVHAVRFVSSNSDFVTEKQKLGPTTQTISMIKLRLVNHGTNIFL